MIKYNIEYKNTEGIDNKITIDDPSYFGSPQDVTGYCIIKAGTVRLPIDCLKGSGLTLILDANQDLDFTDLLTENDRKILVEYTRGGNKLFSGFLNSEGLFQNYVSDKWTISSLVVSDGLSFLNTLSYVDNSTGLPFSGKQSELDIIANCLKRTGLELNIRTSIGISYTNQDPNTNVLAETFLNSERFRKKDNGNTIMNCKEVLCSVLEKYNAVIVQRENTWFIYRPIELAENNGTLDFYVYDSDGVSKGVASPVDLSQDLGSQINGFNPYWSGENQQISYKNRLGAYRINYKYGFVSSFLQNIFLVSSGGVFDDYTVNNTTYFTIPSNERGINLTPYNNGANSPFNPTPNPVQLTSDTFALTADSQIRFVTKFTSEAGLFCTKAIFNIKLVVGATTYSLKNNGTWVTPPERLVLDNGEENVDTPADSPIGTGKEIEYIIDSDTIPGAGNISIEIIAPSYEAGLSATGSIDLNEVSLEPLNAEESNLEGENHTFERTDSPSSKILSTKEVFSADNPSDIYLGTIYEDDETTPTTTWKRDGITESKPILEIMGRDTMICFQSTSKIFKGSVYGYFDYASLIDIDGLSGNFIPIEYNYNTKTNIVSNLKLYEIFSDSLDGNIDYNVQFDYGNVVEPTIKG